MFQQEQVHKLRSMKTWSSKVGVEEFDCHAQGPELNPTELLQDELEHLLHPRYFCPKSVAALTNALVADWVNPQSHFSKSSGRLFIEEWMFHST